MQALLLVAEHDGPTMFARGMMRALNHGKPNPAPHARVIIRAAVWEGTLPYKRPTQGVTPQQCEVCGSPANSGQDGYYLAVACSRCGDFQISREAWVNWSTTSSDDKQRALASYLIRRMQGSKRPILGNEFFLSLSERTLPTPAELCDNLLLWFSQQADGRVGRNIGADKQFSDLDIVASVGAIDGGDVSWAAAALKKIDLVDINTDLPNNSFRGNITPAGWNHIGELQRAHVASRYAFFARKFANDDLDTLYKDCLWQAAADTGFELRTVTQKAGHIDALIEDEIRRCRFLVADLSDDNAGAYWEAGFAEGLGKPVIYICRDGMKTHFDTDHRQTVRWDLTKLGETAARLKAVIRNTLLGDARQED